MNKKAPYQNSINTEKYIKRATLNLLKETGNVDEISISDIAKKARINRGTFYNHYKSVEDVVETIEDEILDEVITILADVQKRVKNSVEFFNAFFDRINMYMNYHESDIKSLVSTLPPQIFEDMKLKLFERSKQDIDNAQDAKLKSKKLEMMILSTGIATAYLEYFKGHINYSLNEIKDHAVAILNKVAFGI